MLTDRDKILSALREKPHKVFEVMKRANISNQEACQSLLLKMRDEGSVKFDIHKAPDVAPPSQVTRPKRSSRDCFCFSTRAHTRIALVHRVGSTARSE
jgi:hypothetical protein